jgi:hypothetical protein
MASRKKSNDGIKNLTSDIEREDIIIRADFEIPWKKIPAGNQIEAKQKSETEKAFACQDKAISDALELF